MGNEEGLRGHRAISHQKLPGRYIILLPVSILQMSKLRLRKAKQFLQDKLTVSRDWNPSSSALPVKVLTTLPTS